jgi:Flp pilus assembly protein TadD
MMSKVALKLAVSALAMGTTMVGCAQGGSTGPSVASARAATVEEGALAAYNRARALVAESRLAEAIAPAEQAVELSPTDSGYRMLLGDLYLRNGRFASAEAAFRDVLTLDPSSQRAGISIALTQVAQGRSGEALDVLDRLAEVAPPADLGLAYALAGQPQRAVEMLEGAARTPGANGRVRQNLALAYALAGEWEKARVTASQDVSPQELNSRLQHWASFAQPKASWDQVASLFNTTAAPQDPGQPVRLALAPRAQDGTAFAAAETPASPEPAAEMAIAGQPALVQTASADETPQWVSASVIENAPPEQGLTEEDTRPVYAEAVEALVKTEAPAVRVAAAPTVGAPARSFDAPRSVRAAKAVAQPRAMGTGRFAVQLGAFGSPAQVERAWASAYKRYGFGGHTPLSTTIRTAGGTFHRLSVAGFASHSEASAVCRSVKAKGGACFVRTVAGDAPVQWASRYAPTRRG